MKPHGSAWRSVPWGLLVAGLLATPSFAQCRTEGVEVICPEEDFKTLVRLNIDARAERDKCLLKLSASEAQVEALKAALAAKPEPVPVPTVKPSVRPVLAVVAATLGAAALTTALVADVDAAARIGLGVTGALGVSAAFIIILP